MSEAEQIVVLKDVKKEFAVKGRSVHVPALRGVTMNIEEGSMVAIKGPSGSGKTTLLNILGGIDTPTGGTVTVEGREIQTLREKDLSAYRRDTVGWIFQFFNLIPSLTAVENVALTLEMARDKEDMMGRAHEALKLVGIPEKADMFPSQLSGGEQQRVAIARALVKRPKIVLADEPTGNLDWATGTKIARLMRDINRKEGTTFVVVSHDISISDVADRVIHLRDGKISKGEDAREPSRKKVKAE